MSLDLDWSLLDAQLADSLLAKLNASLSKAPRPDFIGPISLTSLDFGQDPPDVTLTHLGDVWRELSDEATAAASQQQAATETTAVRHVAAQAFEDEAEDDEGDVIAPGEQGYRGQGPQPMRKRLQPGDHLARLAEHSLPFTGPGVVGPRLQTFRQYTPSDIQQVHGGAAGSMASFPASIPQWANGGPGSASGSGLTTPAWGAGLGTRPWPQRSQTGSGGVVPPSPYYSGMHTPNTSGYFGHWPGALPPNHQQQQPYRRPTYWRASQSGLSASRSPPAWGPSTGDPSPADTPGGSKGPQDPSSSSSTSQLPSMQMQFSVVWSTNTLKLGINTSLVINHPTPAFMQLPLSVSVIGLGVQAGVVVAFEEGDEDRGTMRRVHVSLVEDESGIGTDEGSDDVDDDELEGGSRRREGTSDTIIASGQATTTAAAATSARGLRTPPQYGSRRTSHTQPPPPIHPHQQRPPTVGERLLPHVTLESSVGQVDKHGLRNVGKVEKFIVEVLRKAVEDELVWPNFYTIALPASAPAGPKREERTRRRPSSPSLSNGSL